ncbi:ATP-binding protein [Actinocrispum wychmicini]|uniref:Putative ATPase n=1 Tax=Actinocrispum wychmicini TaxID=1213861 RepID=A0A4R2JPX8_9PSEU|nr:BTAD domain-containing putative transcriptional regulator [Actinocrispum wychmicini]TCO61057.1 putative ATPase [Actinocrispum wychmicini]
MTIELTFLPGVAYQGRDVTAPRLRHLLALLADDLGRGCSTGMLVDGLWPDDQPDNPTKAVQILVSRARTLLGSDVIASTATGYRLTLAEDEVDVAAVLLKASSSSKHLRAGDYPAAIADAEAGLTLYEGAETSDSDDPVATLRADRARTHQSLIRTRAVALSRLGRHADAIGPLTELFDERPRDEELLAELLRSEAATNGPSAALTRYDTYRRELRDDLGTDPGAELQALQQQFLQSDRPTARHGVAHEPNQLLGRADDIAAITALLRTSRVASIIGPGGLGKTRLAHAVSRQAEQRSVHFVPLAGVTSDADVAAEVSAAVGASTVTHPGMAADTVAGIANALGTALLVLDNCEHVIQGAADLTRALVSMTRDVRILTTSRAPLGLSSESIYHLPELTLATTVELFEQRARAARPGVELPTDVVTELCRHLDGLPLAVELAAARVRTMSVAEIARRLDDRFALLRGGSRDAPQRHRTLHAVVDWSWNLLDAPARTAMRALAIFPGGFTAQAAEHMVADAVDTIEHLVDQSLLKVTETPVGTRLAMLETVREFCQASGDNEPLVTEFLAWAKDFGVAYHQAVFGPEPFAEAMRVRADQDNLVHALRLALDRDDRPTVAATTAVLAALWTLDSNYSRISALIRDTAWALSHYRPEPDLVEVTRTALTLSGGTAFLIRDSGPVRALVALRRLPPAPPDTFVRAAAIVLQARTPQAILALSDSPEPLIAGIANALASYGWEKELDHGNALKAARRMLDLFENTTIVWMRVLGHSRIAELSLQLELGEDTRDHLLAALRGMKPWADPIGIHSGLVLANLLLGDIDEAERWLARATTEESEEGYGVRTFHFGAQAEILLARGDVEAGLRLWRRTNEVKFGETWIYTFEPLAFDPWMLEIEATTVVAHVHHGRLDLIEDLIAGVSEKLTVMLTNQGTRLPLSVMELPVCGALLLALGLADIRRGHTAFGVRLVALAERCHYLRGFQPTMSSARVRQVATDADRSAYDDAVSSYADLPTSELRDAALALLQDRGQLTAVR